jgi:cysteinyl-tRNA synthetase
MLRFFNTLSREIEDFKPLEEGKAKVYICGPTVWNFAHIGNFRTFIFGDLLHRYLKFKGYDEMTAPYVVAFHEDMAALNCLEPDVEPRATDHIGEMVAIISTLLENGKAYESDGSIYYRISAFPDYGRLSKISFEGNIEGGSARIDTDKYDKEDARDFALWKLVEDPEATGWDAPFGRGRPGWHIECSAMSMKYLGETFDIHAGGIDLQFPHHENEIAQSEGATGKPFAKYWLHGEFLKIDNEKMAKSLGNDYTFRDIRERGFSPLAIRYLLLSVPYGKQLNFTFEGLKGAESAVERLHNFRRLVRDSAVGEGGQTEASVENLERSISLNPDFANTFYLLGRSKRMLGDREGEMAAYKEAIEREPMHSDAIFALGAAYALECGDRPEIVEYIQTDGRFDLNDPDQGFYAGMASLALGDPKLPDSQAAMLDERDPVLAERLRRHIARHRS